MIEKYKERTNVSYEEILLWVDSVLDRYSYWQHIEVNEKKVKELRELIFILIDFKIKILKIKNGINPRLNIE